MSKTVVSSVRAHRSETCFMLFMCCGRVQTFHDFLDYFCCSNIVHNSAGLGLFAAKDFKKGGVIGAYFGALFLGHKGGFVKLYKLCLCFH